MANPEQIIRALAAKHMTRYSPSAAELALRHVTDEVTLDEVELLLVQLQRDGHVKGEIAIHMHMDYLRWLERNRA